MELIKNKNLYWALIIAFIALYLAVAFVSTLHAITFFQLTNVIGLAILLGVAYELGQAAALFSILITENRNKMAAWFILILLTAVQITANVYASFKYLDTSGSEDWLYWQKAILIGVEAESPEMYKIIISWISGALLPAVALGMTALVAENIRLYRKQLKEQKGIDEVVESIIDPITPEVETHVKDKEIVKEKPKEVLPGKEENLIDELKKPAHGDDIERQKSDEGDIDKGYASKIVNGVEVIDVKTVEKP